MHPSNITARRAVIAAVSAGVLVLGCHKAEQAGPQAESEAPAAAPAAAPPGPVPVIVAPAEGTVVAPGATVRVVVHTTATRVLVVGRDTTAVDESAPFELDLVIPKEAMGSFPIKAAGASADGTFAESNTVTLNVKGATLQSMQIVPKEMILFGPGSTRHLSVLGTFSDGVTRVITDSSTGTTYEASGEGVVSVSPEGVVTALSFGAATVTAWNKPHNSTVSIHVMPSPSP